MIMPTLLCMAMLWCGALRLGDTTPQPATMPYHVIIAGGRDFNNAALLHERCDHYLRLRTDVVVISGGARGADSLGEGYARMRGLGLVRMPAEWERHGRQAGYLRNKAMALRAQALIAFWDGRSTGTRHMIQLATSMGLAVRVVRYTH